MHNVKLAGLLGTAALMLVAACGGSATTAPSAAGPSAASGAPTCVAGTIIANGSTALQPLVAAAAQQYQAACSGSTVTVGGGGSGTGLTQVSQGAATIGDSDVFAAEKLATPDADALTDHQVVHQGFVMVLNKSITGVTNLTTDQAKQIWTGAITNWNKVGGPDQQIVLILRPTSSGTRATFKKIVLGGADEGTGANAQTLTSDSNGDVAQAVISTPGATSVIGFTYFADNTATLTGVQLDGVDATLANMSSGTYKLQSIGHMYTKGEATGLAKAFLDYMVSDAIQHTLVPSMHYAPIN